MQTEARASVERARNAVLSLAHLPATSPDQLEALTAIYTALEVLCLAVEELERGLATLDAMRLEASS